MFRRISEINKRYSKFWLKLSFLNNANSCIILQKKMKTNCENISTNIQLNSKNDKQELKHENQAILN